MAGISPIDREIVKRTYGIDLRKPIHDAIYILAKDLGDYRPVRLLTQEEYDSLEIIDPDYDYAIIYEGGA